MNAVQHVNSYYAASAHDQSIRPRLNQDLVTDVCVIGAGYTGLSTAIHLAESGLGVVVLEGTKVGFGASGRNGGQIVHSYSRDMDFIEQRFGPSVAKKMGSMAFEGGNIIRRFIRQYDIGCDLKNGGIFAACTRKQLNALQQKKALWEAYGHTQLTLLDATYIQKYVGSKRYIGGLLDESAGHLHPLNLAQGEARALESLGGKIYEGSEVVKIKRGTPASVLTKGGSVAAKSVVIACNAYLGNLVPALSAKAMPCGSQIIVTAPLPKELLQEILPGGHSVEDCNYLLDYFRLSADGRLIYGGGVSYGARAPKRIENNIVPNMLKTFPQLKGIRIDYAWTGNFLLTLMRLPQLGCLDCNLFYSQGYSGHGLTSSHLCGQIISDAIQGKRDRYNVFADLPQYPFPGGKNFRIPLTAIGAAYYQFKDKLGL